MLRWIGDRLSPIGRWIGDRFSWVPESAQPWVGAAALIVLAIVIGIFVRHVVAARVQARRCGSDRRRRRARAGNRRRSRALDAAAAEAEARGDLALAVRLRFRAGLLRLDRDAHAISYRPSIPTVEVRAELASPTFDGLADTFEGITYGGADAEPADTEEAKRDWPRVVQAARRR